ncbi:MAG: hypothetical protein PHS51_14440 [Gallionella sp.]|nr:hypothetical protein [Gallionella sp.]
MGFALIDLLGYVWFSATLPFALVMPPFVMLVTVLTPLKILTSERWLLVSLATIYVASYVFGCFDFALKYDQLITWALPQTAVITYFFVRAVSLEPV